MNNLLVGALAGLVATAPMTAVMELLHESLPGADRVPLPPREIAMKVADEAGIRKQMDENERTAMTISSHLAYGAAAGALYPPLARRIGLHPVFGGIGFGVAVWAGSYMGWLPGVGLMPAASEQPSHRNVIMFTAHMVWGAVLGVTAEAFSTSKGQ
jgi:hypothetical protein